jgi:hypothetical protein
MHQVLKRPISLAIILAAPLLAVVHFAGAKSVFATLAILCGLSILISFVYFLCTKLQANSNFKFYTSLYAVLLGIVPSILFEYCIGIYPLILGWIYAPPDKKAEAFFWILLVISIHVFIAVVFFGIYYGLLTLSGWLAAKVKK